MFCTPSRHFDHVVCVNVAQVAAEALRVCEQMVSVIRPNPPAPTAAELSPVVSGMFSCINSRLAAQDQDQEVKECAILCMAHLVATCGDLLSAEVRAVACM
jgi:cullin-associated NEDD8-dissociated protein 1